MKVFSLTRVVWVVVVLVLMAGAMEAQTAQLSGVIKDKSEAIIPNAKLVLTNDGTGIKREVNSNDLGLYSIPFVQPGNYKLDVRAPGFQPIIRTGIVLEVGQSARLDLVLEVGRVEQTVDVTGEAPLMNESAAVGTVINRQFVGNLPLNGRSFQSLILLTPGVTVNTYSTSNYGQFSVNGQRASTNYFTVDGVSANFMIGDVGSNSAANTGLGGAYPTTSAFGGTNNLVSVDALEEFKIQTSTYAAEFGRQPGGQISLVTRSGSNQFHGTMFEYLRNDVMDANDWFANAKGLKKAPLRQNQFGGTFSGPVVIPALYDGHDRTFFFFSYEGQRLRLPVTGTVNVPSMRVRSAAANSVKPIINAIPQPNGAEYLTTAGVLSGFAPYVYSISNPSTMDAYSIRLDHTVSSKLTLFGRFNQSPSNATTYYGGAYGSKSIASTRTLTFGANSALTSRLNNELRFNYSYQTTEVQYVPATFGGAVPVDTALLTNGLGGRGTVYFYWGGYNTAVNGGDFVVDYQRQINAVDNISLVKGAHQLKFGIDYRRLAPTYGVKQLQTVYFRSEASVKNAIADTVNLANYSAADPLFMNFSLYGQDTWKVTPRLTLDLGLRWELNPAPSVPRDEMSAIVEGITGNPPDVTKATLAPPDTPFYKTFYRAFAPRVGAAYQLNQTSGRETVLRGGFGVYYDLGSAGASTALGLYASSSLANVPFPLSAANATRPALVIPTSLPVTTTVYSDPQDLKLPYSLQWNMALEQSLGTHQSLSLSYVASAARRLLANQMLNYPAGYTTGPRPNPNFSSMTLIWNGPSSDYHSLQAQYKAQFTRSTQALVNYTWSHAIDAVSTEGSSYALSRGSADFDVRHNLSAAVTYSLPSLNAATVFKQLISNWFVDGIVHAQTGRPVNVFGSYTVIDGILTTVRPNYVSGQPLYIYDTTVAGGRRFNSAAFSMPTSIPGYPSALQQGNFGRNVMRELAIWQADFALGRSFNFTEKWKLQFKGELFNVFNHPNFGSYNFFYTTASTFGVPTSMLNRSLGGLSYLYQMGGPRSVQVSLRLSF